jgi:hypothetical protein
MLSRAYPASVSRGDVHRLVVNVNRFRNRLAHNEPVFSTKTGLVKWMEEPTQHSATCARRAHSGYGNTRTCRA